jgi:hypothetical protein
MLSKKVYYRSSTIILTIIHNLIFVNVFATNMIFSKLKFNVFIVHERIKAKPLYQFCISIDIRETF